MESIVAAAPSNSSSNTSPPSLSSRATHTTSSSPCALLDTVGRIFEAAEDLGAPLPLKTRIQLWESYGGFVPMRRLFGGTDGDSVEPVDEHVWTTLTAVDPLAAEIEILYHNAHLLKGKDPSRDKSLSSQGYFGTGSLNDNPAISTTSNARAIICGDQSYRCSHPLCKHPQKAYNTRSELKHHHRTHVAKECRPHACKHCKSRFLYPKDLRRHMKTHTSQRTYSCPICSKAFNRNDNAERHIASVHPGTYGRDDRHLEDKFLGEPVANKKTIEMAGFGPLGARKAPSTTIAPKLKEMDGIALSTAKAKVLEGRVAQAKPRIFRPILGPLPEEFTRTSQVIGLRSTGDLGEDLGRSARVSEVLPWREPSAQESDSTIDSEENSPNYSQEGTCNCLARECHAAACAPESPPRDPAIAAFVSRIQQCVGSPNGDAAGAGASADVHSSGATKGKNARKGSWSGSNKRKWEESDENGEGSGMPGNEEGVSRSSGESERMFACPAAKHNPNLSCRWKGYPKFCRITQHLRRSHLDEQGRFHPDVGSDKTRDELDQELRRLRYGDAAEKCRSLYRFLYPNEDVPNPFLDANIPPFFDGQFWAHYRALEDSQRELANQNEALRRQLEWYRQQPLHAASSHGLELQPTDLTGARTNTVAEPESHVLYPPDAFIYQRRPGIESQDELNTQAVRRTRVEDQVHTTGFWQQNGADIPSHLPRLLYQQGPGIERPDQLIVQDLHDASQPHEVYNELEQAVPPRVSPRVRVEPAPSLGHQSPTHHSYLSMTSEIGLVSEEDNNAAGSSTAPFAGPETPQQRFDFNTFWDDFENDPEFRQLFDPNNFLDSSSS